MHKDKILLALSKINLAIANSSELKPTLSVILESIVEILRFDAAKLYLIDKKDNVLKGVACAGKRETATPIEMERYDIEKGAGSIADSLFGQNGSRSGLPETILPIPLLVYNAEIGVLLVDNAFSGRPITKEERENMEVIANLAAAAIEKARLYEEVKELSIRDSLTGMYTYNFFMARLEEEVRRAARSKEKFSLIIIDIDGFKRYNELYGRQIGDKVIISVADIIKLHSRSFDVKSRPLGAVGRYGGDEFIVLLARAESDTALIIGNRMREKAKTQQLKIDDKPVSFTISMGIAIYPDNGAMHKELLRKAEEALWCAKQRGTDQICLAKDIGKGDSKLIF